MGAGLSLRICRSTHRHRVGTIVDGRIPVVRRRVRTALTEKRNAQEHEPTDIEWAGVELLGISLFPVKRYDVTTAQTLAAVDPVQMRIVRQSRKNLLTHLPLSVRGIGGLEQILSGRRGGTQPGMATLWLPGSINHQSKPATQTP